MFFFICQISKTRSSPYDFYARFACDSIHHLNKSYEMRAYFYGKYYGYMLVKAFFFAHSISSLIFFFMLSYQLQFTTVVEHITISLWFTFLFFIVLFFEIVLQVQNFLLSINSSGFCCGFFLVSFLQLHLVKTRKLKQSSWKCTQKYSKQVN